MAVIVSMTVNGNAVSAEVENRTLLVQYLREHLRLTGTHVGCDTSQCGACVVHVNGESVKSCTLLAVQAEGAEVVLSEKTKAIVSFALCGFANLSSIAILLGGLGSLAPSRRPDIARFGLKAVLAATLSNLMSATIAGLFLSL